MSWVKLDDQIFGHPKILRAGKDARDVFLVALAYCASQLTDGFIPETALPMIGALAIVDSISDCTERLVTVRLWERVAGGYFVHDYLQYQPSGEKVRQERRANAKRQSTFREKHGDEIKEKRNAMSNAVTNADSNAMRNGRVTGAPSPSYRDLNSKGNTTSDEEGVVGENLSLICAEVAKAAGLAATAESLRKLVTRHRGLERDGLLLEAAKAAEWIGEHSKRKMTLRFLDNWLDKAEHPPQHQQQSVTFTATPARPEPGNLPVRMEATSPFKTSAKLA